MVQNTTIDEILAVTEADIQGLRKAIEDLDSKLREKVADRDAFLRVKDRIGTPTPVHSELIPSRPQDSQIAWGMVTNAVEAFVKHAGGRRVTVKEAATGVLRTGLRPNGDLDNFGVTVAKCLKRLAKKGFVIEHKNGRFITYTFANKGYSNGISHGVVK